MNTVKKGDILEENAIPIIEKYINDGYFGPKDCIKLFKKKKYPTKIRTGFVEFDLSVEFTPPLLDKPSLTYFIECKNYKGRLPCDQIKKFKSDIDEVKGYNVKGILISATRLQKGGYDFAEAYGIMVLVGENVENHKIILPRTSLPKEAKLPFIKDSINKKILDEGILLIEKQIDKSILAAFLESLSKVSFGIDKMSKEQITNFSELELNKINPDCIKKADGINTRTLIEFIKKEYNLEVNYTNKINNLGSIDLEDKIISINKGIKGTNRELFVLCHEFGHFKLHYNLTIDNALYNSFSDTIQTFRRENYKLKNPKQWIEWQANYFATSLIVPETSIVAILSQNQLRAEMHNDKLILSDSNRKEVFKIINSLAYHFNCSKTIIMLRLQEIGFFENKSRLKHISEILPEVMDEYII